MAKPQDAYDSLPKPTIDDNLHIVFFALSLSLNARPVAAAVAAAAAVPAVEAVAVCPPETLLLRRVRQQREAHVPVRAPASASAGAVAEGTEAAGPFPPPLQSRLAAEAAVAP